MLRQILRDPASLTALALISLATLLPGTGRGGWNPGLPDAADLLLNIALFVPLGMALTRQARTFGRGWPRPYESVFRPRGETRGSRHGLGQLRSLARPTHPKPWWRQPPHHAEPEARASGSLRVAVVAAFLLSLGIELAQLTVIPGRDSSPWDLAANASGAFLGAAVPAHLLVLPLIPAWLASGWLLAPAPAPSAVWWGQWAHQFGSSTPFSGTIRAVTFNQVEAPRHRLDESVTAQMKAGYLSPPIQLTVTLNPPSSSSVDRNQVAGIADGQGGEVIGLWQLGWDLTLRWHARGTRWGLRQPAVRAPGLLEGLPQPEATIGASLELGHAFIQITSSHTFGILLGPWQGWRLFWPVEPPRPPLAVLLSILWSATCLGVPLVAIIVRVRHRRL